MKSPLISAPQKQLTLSCDAGLSERHRCLRDCVATGIYQRGLSSVAIDLNKAPGNLSVELSGDSTRHFSIDSLEAYIEKTGDTTPIHYLIEKFLREKSSKQDEALAQLAPIFAQLAPLMRRAGLTT